MSSSSFSADWWSSSSSSSPSGNGHSELYNDLETWYRYQPNEGLAVAAFILFGILSVILCVQSFRYLHGRYWYTLALPIAATAECMGYIARYVTTQGIGGKNVFTTQLALILITPNVFAFTNYATVGHILQLLDALPAPRTLLRVPIITDSTAKFLAGRIAAFFFLSDIISLVIQIGSIPFLTSSNSSDVSKGQTIVEVGLAWALASVGLFWFITAYIYLSPRYRLSSHPHFAVLRRMFSALFITIGMLSIRSLYRLIEYCLGYDGYLNTHEVWFYCFDTLLMLIACVVYVSTPFGAYLSRVSPAGEEKTRVDDDVELAAGQRKQVQVV